MTTLYVFNPEHDIALAANLANFTAPHAGRQLRTDLGFLPALWAGKDDVVWVDNVDYAERQYQRLIRRIAKSLELPALAERTCRFHASSAPLPQGEVQAIEPWGWDAALRATLRRRGVSDDLLPTDAELDQIRQLSHRRIASALLPRLQMDGTVGESFECRTEAEVETLLQRYGQVVMKAPWSSSGRGLRFLSVDRTPLAMQAGWLRNMVERQGSVMVEPFYHKVKDFGMEFCVDEHGIHYLGLSLFHTVNGAYVGNILATENAKRQMISRYVSVDLLDEIKQNIIDRLQLGTYCGPFGVDMMIVAPTFTVHRSPSTVLHPCVEINLRRTMGHVALALMPQDDEIVRVMRIELTDHYKLKINKL